MVEIKTTVFQLYSFISKMMRFVEGALDECDSTSKDIESYRHMTQIFEKLVSLIIQLNKLSKEEKLHVKDTLPKEDMAIIERFMEKHQKQRKNQEIGH